MDIVLIKISSDLIFLTFIGLYICILKKNLYYRDRLHINENNVRLNREKRFFTGGAGAPLIRIVEESNIEKLNFFKETTSKFILYGKVKVESSKSSGSKREKQGRKLVIRKNFDNEKEIRRLLNDAIKLGKMIETGELIDKIKYYRLYSNTSKEEIIFKKDIDNLWMFLSKEGI